MSCLRNGVYLLLLMVFLPLLLWQAVVTGKYRAGWKEKLFGRVPMLGKPAGKRLWFHAVSVGEVVLLRAILPLISERHPDWECVVSTTSLAGQELAERLFSDYHRVFYCPLDFSWSVREAMRRIRPDTLVLAEQELWHHLIFAAKESGAAVVVINGRFSVGGFRRYRRFRWLFRSMMEQLDGVAAQSETYAAWFAELGTRPEAIQVTGSMKFDGAESSRANAATKTLSNLAGLSSESNTANDVVFLAGSTQHPEETFAINAYLSLRTEFPQLRLIIVPRHPQRFDEVAAMLDASGVEWERRSQLTGKSQSRVLLVDTVGELGAWWGTADIAFVGGSIHKRGGQNMIEPAAYGAAVAFGPNTSNFRDIVSLLLNADAACVVRDQREMAAFVRRCLEEPEFRRDLGDRARNLVASQRGATEKTLTIIENLTLKAAAK